MFQIAHVSSHTRSICLAEKTFYLYEELFHEDCSMWNGRRNGKVIGAIVCFNECVFYWCLGTNMKFYAWKNISYFRDKICFQNGPQKTKNNSVTSWFNQQNYAIFFVGNPQVRGEIFCKLRILNGYIFIWTEDIHSCILERCGLLLIHNSYMSLLQDCFRIY